MGKLSRSELKSRLLSRKKKLLKSPIDLKENLSSIKTTRKRPLKLAKSSSSLSNDFQKKNKKNGTLEPAILSDSDSNDDLNYTDNRLDNESIVETSSTNFQSSSLKANPSKKNYSAESDLIVNGIDDPQSSNASSEIDNDDDIYQDQEEYVKLNDEEDLSTKQDLDNDSGGDDQFKKERKELSTSKFVDENFEPLEIDGDGSDKTRISISTHDLVIINNRIEENLNILLNFTKVSDKKHSRQQYLDILIRDLCHRFGYNEFLMKKLIDLFPLDSILDFLNSCEKPNPVTIRSNSLKIRRRDLAKLLISRGVNLDPIGEWSKVGILVKQTPIPIGATPEYLAGYYMLQGASSLLPVMALNPTSKNEHILDMCSAPGGKTTYIASLMRNKGVLVANDLNKDRLSSLTANIYRMGVTNCIVTNYDGREFPKIGGKYDRILLDAPCSGTGIISRDASVKVSKDEKDIQFCAYTQKELILAAIDVLKVNKNSDHKNGPCLVYSTCSILPEENESVIEYALKKRCVKLVPTGVDFGCEGFTKIRQYRFSPNLKMARRIYPHIHNMDGFFFAKLIKVAESPNVKSADVKNFKSSSSTLSIINNKADFSPSSTNEE